MRRQIKALPSGPPADARYALMVDSGSKGSRIFVYWYTNVETGAQANSIPTVDQVIGGRGIPVKFKVAPGLDTFQNNLTALDAYLKLMLDFAAKYVPADKRDQTSISILETVSSLQVKYNLQWVPLLIIILVLLCFCTSIY